MESAYHEGLGKCVEIPRQFAEQHPTIKEFVDASAVREAETFLRLGRVQDALRLYRNMAKANPAESSYQNRITEIEALISSPIEISSSSEAVEEKSWKEVAAEQIRKIEEQIRKIEE